MLNFLRNHHEDVVLQVTALKPVLERVNLLTREYKRKWSQTSEELRHLRTENKRLRAKVDDFHRSENALHKRLEEHESTFTQLKKELG